MLIRKQKTWGSRLLATVALVAVAGTGLAFTDDDAKTPKGDPWPLDTCAVSGEKLDSMGDAIVYDHEGRDIRFCCKACIGAFKKNPDEYLAKADKQIIEQQMKTYPLDTCVVMETEALGSDDMGDPVNLVYKNRLVRFCCKGCVRKFKKDPAAYLAKIDKAVIKQQMKDYPLENCVVMDDESLGEEPINHVFATRLVRFCCKGCLRKFNKDPLAYLAKIDAKMEAKN